tara:strand:- start:1346 stop:1702 length:357 start_codon:yes stop_codon:yes gene_type:complete
MNIYKVSRTYHRDQRTTWHDSKMVADTIVNRHKRLGKKFMKKLDQLSAKYPPEKRELHGYLAEVYLREKEDLVERFAEEHNENDAPMKWAEIEKVSVRPSRSGIVALIKQIDTEWPQG